MRFTRAGLVAMVFGLMALFGWTPLVLIWSQGLTWSEGVGNAMSIWYPFAALLATLIVQGPVLRQPVLGPLGLRFSPNRWWLVAWMVPLLVLVIAMLTLWLLGQEPVLTVEQLIENRRTMIPDARLEDFDRGVLESPPPHPLMLIVLGLPAGLTFGLLLALGAELAFRGFFFRELAGQFWARSSTIGLLWWLWLAPSIALGNLYGEPGWQAVALALPWFLVASWILVYLRVRSGSVIATAMCMGTVLTLTRPAHELSFGAAWWLRPYYGLTGILGLGLVWLALWIVDRRRTHGRLTGPGGRQAEPAPAGETRP